MSKNDFAQILNRLATIQKEIIDLEYLIKGKLVTEKKPDTTTNLPLPFRRFRSISSTITITSQIDHHHTKRDQ